MFIMTRTPADAWWMRDNYLPYEHPYAWTELHIKNFQSHPPTRGLHWWDGESDPEFGNIKAYWQTGTVEELHQQILKDVTPGIEKRKAVLARIKAAHPLLDLREYTSSYGFWVRVYNETEGGSHECPIDLDAPDIDVLATYAEQVKIVRTKLYELYPNLMFYPGSINNIDCTLHHVDQPKPWHVNIRRSHTDTAFYFNIPRTEADKLELDRLNTEAIIPNTFFCSGCRKAQPMDMKAGWHFHTVLCTNCATPKWLKMAREETYE